MKESQNANEIIETIKEIIRKGNVARITVFKGDKQIFTLPVTAGILGTAAAVAILSTPTVLVLSGLIVAGHFTDVITIKVIKR